MGMRNLFVILTLLLTVVWSCKKDEPETPEIPEEPFFINAVDISSFPEISLTSPVFYNQNGMEEEFTTILKNAGVNTIRLRLWVNPGNEHSGFNEVKNFSASLKSKGFKIWLAPHYSDTWADPGRQETPAAWKKLSFEQLKDTVFAYTSRIVQQINPDYIQIGNEINAGFLFPAGNISNNPSQFNDLVATGIEAVRTNSESAKIIIHFAGISGSDWFYNRIDPLDYDIIGISYYPWWHGKNLSALRSTLDNLSAKYNRKVMIAETAYPFTLDWNDFTNNIVGLEEHLILPDYPASGQGQHDFLKEIKSIVSGIDKGAGFGYWGAELIAWKGPQATDGSVWENQALFDFGNRAVQALSVFSDQ